MSIIGWAVLGLIAGGLARYLLPGRQGGGIIWTILVGVAGSMLGGWIGTRIGWGTVNSFDFRSIGLAVLGSMALLFVFDVLQKKR